jgi:glycosyltransferase involved in cell wall biosynthesis
MPYNEFILYRNKYYKEEKQVVFLTGKEISIPYDQIPESLEIHQIGKNPYKLHKELKKLLIDLASKKMDYVIHLHSIRGSFSTLIGMLGTPCRKHTVYTIHSTFTGYRFHNKLLSSIDAFFSEYVTCVSNTSYSAFPEYIKKIKKEKMYPVQNGVNLDRIDEKICNTKKRGHSEIVCVYIARIVPLKNHKFLIDVLKHTNENIRFVFVGEEETDEARRYAEEAGVIDRITFTGLVPREEVYDILVNSDIYISSSTLEGLPISVLEAMYCGLPVVLSDIPQHREVTRMIEGTKCIEFDSVKWSNALESIACLSEEERRRLGQNCKLFVADNFSLKRMHSEYDTIYTKIVENL